MAAETDEVHKILAIELGGLGDLLLATPSLRALKKRYPDAHLTVLSIPRSAEMVEGLPYVDEIRLLDLRDAQPARWLRSPGSLVRLTRALLALRRERFDATLNLRTINSISGALKMAAIFYCCGSKLKLGRNTEGRGFFLNRSVPEKDFDVVPEVEFAARVVRLLGASVADLTPDLAISDADERGAEELLRAEGLGSRPILGVNPGAGYPSKQWPIERFAEVVNTLRPELDCDVVATGSAGESPIADRLGQLTGGAVNLAGRTTLKQLAVLIKRMRLFITNDTGPMHIAAAVGARLVAIFGPGEYDRYRPIGPAERVAVIRADVDCAPCPRYACRSMKCLRAISVADVVGPARRLCSEAEHPNLAAKV